MEPVQIGRGDTGSQIEIPREAEAAMEPVQIGRGDLVSQRTATVLSLAAMEPVQIGRGDSPAPRRPGKSTGRRNGARPDRTG